MLDIDKELRALSQNKQIPDDAVREKTRALVRREYQQMLKKSRHSAAAPQHRIVRWAGVCAAAAAVLLALVLVLSPAQTALAAAYYTIDINPSVSLGVDANDVVLSASAGNSDAETLLKDVSLVGLPISDALQTIVRAATEGGWLKDGGHVLVGHFGDTPGITTEQAETIVGGVSSSTVKVLVLQSTKTDYESAENEHQNAGIELLKKNAQCLGLNAGADVDSVISAIMEKENGQHSNNVSAGNNKTEEDSSAIATEKPVVTPSPKKTHDANPSNSGEKPDVKKPETGKPETGKPGNSNPDVSKPGNTSNDSPQDSISQDNSQSDSKKDAGQQDSSQQDTNSQDSSGQGGGKNQDAHNGR